MNFLDRIEKRFGHLAVPNVVLVLIMAQLVLYATIIIGKVDYGSLLLIPKAVLGGDWWRMISFLLAPPTVAAAVFSPSRNKAPSNCSRADDGRYEKKGIEEKGKGF